MTAPILLMLLARLNRLVGQRAEGGRAVGIGTIVAVHIHKTVTVPRAEPADGTVDGNLLMVAAPAVTACI